MEQRQIVGGPLPVEGKRGVFIVLEGLDRSGKSTQCHALLKELLANGTPARVVNFPDRETRIGRLLDSYLSCDIHIGSERATHLLFSANRWENAQRIRELLESGTCVICDRYAHSGAAYSAAKGLPLEWCMDADRGLPAPDLVVYLNMNPAESIRRIGYGEERYEVFEFQCAVRSAFEKLRDPTWKFVSASLERGDITEKLVAWCRETIDGCQYADISLLWTKTISIYRSPSTSQKEST